MLTYISQLIARLSETYSVEYREEIYGEYSIVDCFVLNGICIKLDRLDVESLSRPTLDIIVQSIHEVYGMCVERLVELGHDISNLG